MPGAVWWVGGLSGALSRGAVGHACIEPGRIPATESTVYDLASLTKALVTAPLLVLAEQEGALDLSLPVSDYLDQFSGTPAGQASLLSLATHTAGFPAWEPLFLEASSLDGYLRAIATLPRAGSEGEVLYSDLGYIVLGAVLESVWGEGLDRLFQKRIADPLKLRLTGFARPGQPVPDAAATERGSRYEAAMAGGRVGGHGFRTEVLRGVVHDCNAHGLSGVAGHAGLFGVASEIAELVAEWLSPNRLAFGDRARQRLLTVVPPAPDRTVGMVTAQGASAARGVLPDTAPGHVGFTGSSVWLDPASESIFILLTNRVHPTVHEIDFQCVRNEFHQAAAALIAG
jgi:CubicO group peptidase (beta-lactamase class C family)